MKNNNSNITLIKFDKKKFLCIKSSDLKQESYFKNIMSVAKENFQDVTFLVSPLKIYSKKITLNGLGYKVEQVNNNLVFSLGYSTKKLVAVPSYISGIKIKKNVLILESKDNVLLGNFANEICKLRLPNAYKLKGLLLEGRHINRKEVKKK